MAIDPTAKKHNVRMSVKKFLSDELETVKGKSVFFDLGFTLPAVDDLTNWFSVVFGPMHRAGLAEFTFDLIVATRKDPEGDQLAAMADIGFDVLTDSTQVDGKRRIPFYDVVGETWTQMGALIVSDVMDSGEMEGPDKTKYQQLTSRVRWVAKA